MSVHTGLDPLIAATGGRRLVATRPGVGWLTFEVIPAYVWTQITGGMSFEFFYTVAFLTALGVTDTQLVWLPLAMFAANLGQVALHLGRRPQDPKRRCVVDTLIGRILWLGSIAWPLLAWHLAWGVPMLLAGTVAFIFLSQLLHMAGASNFVAWSQVVVPRELRGLFFAWRSIGSFLVVALCLASAGALLPGSEDGARSQVLGLAGLLTVATVVGIIGIWPLALSPGMPDQEHLRPYRPLREILAKYPGIPVFTVWFALISAATAAGSAMLPRVVLEAGITEVSMARWQAAVFYPAMLLAVLATARLLPRIHGRRTLLLTHLAWIAGEVLVLPLNVDNAWWLLPLSQAVLGAAKGAWSIAWINRLQEICPGGDPRLVGLVIGAGAAVGLFATLILGPSAGTIASWLPHGGSLAWVLLLVSVGLRLVATPLLLLVRRDESP